MSVYKRCVCESWLTCPHPYHYRFGWRGVTYRGSTKERTKQLAERAEGEKLAALKRGETTLRKVPTFATYLPEFDTWIENHQMLRRQTKIFYGRGSKLLAASKLAKLPLDRITDSICVSIRFSKGGPASENQALRTLRSVLSEATKAGWLPRPPRLSLRPEEGRKLLLDDAAELALAPYLPEDGRDVICLMRQSGMRPGELLAMNWQHVDFENCYYRNPRGKTKRSERIVPFASAGMEYSIVATSSRDYRAKAGSSPILGLDRDIGLRSAMNSVWHAIRPVCLGSWCCIALATMLVRTS